MKIEAQKRILQRISVDPESGCWNWCGGLSKSRYGYIKIKHQSWRAHRLSYVAFIGDIPDGLVVCHKCDNPPCVNPWHLFLGTQKDNVIDMIQKFRHNPLKGEANFLSKLTDLEVLEIYHIRRSTDLNFEDIACMFNIHADTVRGICEGKYWRHLGLPPYKRRDRKNVRLGKNKPNSKLTECQVREIFKLQRGGYSQRDIARQFGVSRSVISDILMRRTWKHVHPVEINC